jgi:hypothetical protein
MVHSRPFLPFLLAGCLLPAQDDARVVALRSLQPYTVPHVQSGDCAATALPGEAGLDFPLRLEAAPETPPPTWVVAWLERRHARAIDAGTIELRLVRSRDHEMPTLAMAGSADAVAACQRDLDALAAVTARPILVEAWALPLGDGELPPTHWATADVERQLRERPPTWTGRATTRSGGGVRLAQERWIGHVRDVDVEVAQDQRISDPKVDLAFAGLRLGLVVHALPDEELLLDGQWLHSEPVALHEQSSGPMQPTIDLPEHRTAAVSFSGRIRSGEALAVSGRGGNEGPAAFLLVVRARHGAPPAPPLPDGELVVPVSALTQRRSQGQLGGACQRPGDDGPAFPEFPGPDPGYITGNQLEGLLTTGTIGDHPPTVAGDVLCFTGTSAECANLAATLRALQQDLLQQAELRHEVRGPGGTALELALPVLHGRTAAAFVGRERAIVRDHETEIASGAAMTNPVVGAVRSGLWTHVQLRCDTAGWRTEGCWSLAAQAPLRSREHASEPPATMQLPTASLAVFPWDGPFPAGAEQDLGEGPAWTPAGPPTRLFVRLAPRSR